jgi:hypothetical protein
MARAEMRLLDLSLALALGACSPASNEPAIAIPPSAASGSTVPDCARMPSPTGADPCNPASAGLGRPRRSDADRAPPVDSDDGADTSDTDAGARAIALATGGVDAGAPFRYPPAWIPARDLRRFVVQPRPASTILPVLGALERLFASTPAGAPDRPVLARRLAESYVELSRAGGPAHASAKAIGYYTLVAQTYPNDPQLDDVLYSLGLEYELAGDRANARRSYYELIQKAPQSRLVPYAYFAFGELFFEESTTDRAKIPLAAQAYKEVMKHSASAIAPEARRRMQKLGVKSP